MIDRNTTMHPTVTVITSLYNCINFIESYLNYVKCIQNDGEIEFLLLHNQPKQDEVEVIRKLGDDILNLNHIIIPQREGLYETWNRGIKLAKGKFLTIWNVDDIREPDSFASQVASLNNNPEAMLCYGDFFGTNTYGKNKDKEYTYPEWTSSNKEFLRSHLIGCFPMWRKEVHNEIGYFDEGFKLVADYEFQIRLALAFPLVKCEGILGYYLENQPHKLSSQNNVQDIERTTVELRYGIYYKMDASFLLSVLKRYHVNKVRSFGVLIPIANLVKNYTKNRFNNFYYLLVTPFYTVKQVSKRLIKALIFKKA